MKQAWRLWEEVSKEIYRSILWRYKCPKREEGNTKSNGNEHNVIYIIAFVADLIEKVLMYESEGDVYFITEKLKDTENSATNVSKTYKWVQVISPQKMMKKRNPLDSLLWKKANQMKLAESSMGRDSGWHIECLGGDKNT